MVRDAVTGLKLNPEVERYVFYFPRRKQWTAPERNIPFSWKRVTEQFVIVVWTYSNLTFCPSLVLFLSDRINQLWALSINSWLCRLDSEIASLQNQILEKGGALGVNDESGIMQPPRPGPVRFLVLSLYTYLVVLMDILFSTSIDSENNF